MRSLSHIGKKVGGVWFGSILLFSGLFGGYEVLHGAGASATDLSMPDEEVARVLPQLAYTDHARREITATTGSVHARPVEPQRIRIPDIGVNATIESIGIGRSGRIAVPYKLSSAGWYRYGPIPGDRGTAYIVGHVDNGFGSRGVFGNLHRVQVGNTIEIVDKNGASVVYEVVGSSVWNAEANSSVLETGYESGLALVTCMGRWDSTTMSYSDRLVVYAKKVDL